METSWEGYANTGDEWLVAAVQLQNSDIAYLAPSACYFVAAHTLELFLKAALMKAGVKVDTGKHASFGNWESASALPKFPIDVKLRPHIYETLDYFGISDGKVPELKDGDAKHLLHNQTLYMALRHSVDIKYLWAGGKSLPKGPMAVGWAFPDLILLHRLNELRIWLAHKSRATECIDGLFTRLAEKLPQPGAGEEVR